MLALVGGRERRLDEYRLLLWRRSMTELTSARHRHLR
jgi:hypothetical protein